MSILTLPGVNGSSTIEYRASHNYPVPYIVTIERRILTPTGREYRDGSSRWRVTNIAHLQVQIQLDGPVAKWLRNTSQVGCSIEQILNHSNPNGLAHLWSVNAPFKH